MHFSDDDLRSALGRKEPSTDFAAKVMARIGKPQREEKPPAFAWWRRPWAMASAFAVCLLVVVGVLQYHHYQQEQIKAEKAREQAVIALRITSEKLNVALRQAFYLRKSNH